MKKYKNTKSYDRSKKAQKPKYVAIHWLSRHPTPYNDFLFLSLAKDVSIDLTVHFRDPVLTNYPWKTTFGKSYRSRNYNCCLGIDWHLICTIFRDKNAIFVIAGWDHPTSILLINLLILMGRKFILWTDTPNFFKQRHFLFAFLRSAWLKFVFQRAHKIMGTGKPAADVLTNMGAPKDNILIFPYIIDINHFSNLYRIPKTDNNQTVRFITCGRLIKSLKGQDIALKALAQAMHIAGNNFEYFIAGAGQDEIFLKELSILLGIENNVKFLGWIEQDKLAEYFRCVDVLVHPSPVHEPYGVAVIEAMASGLPVLASNVTCAALDRIENGVNGFIHPAGNVQILSEHITFLLMNPQKIDEFGRNARNTAEKWPIERAVAIIKKAIL